jgi:hypothetical protein
MSQKKSELDEVICQATDVQAETWLRLWKCERAPGVVKIEVPSKRPTNHVYRKQQYPRFGSFLE